MMHAFRFSAAAVDLLPPYRPTIGVNKLMLVLPTAQGLAGGLAGGLATRIVIGLSLGKAAVPVVSPLARWKAAGPFER